jgi:hypothetical protein
MVLEEAEKLYNSLADLFVCEVINESVSKQSSAAALPPALPLVDKQQQQNDFLPKDKR